MEQRNRLQLGTFVFRILTFSHQSLSSAIIFLVPRCECTDDSQCGAQGPGYYCESCECKLIPGFSPDVACDPDDFECSTRESDLFLYLE